MDSAPPVTEKATVVDGRSAGPVKTSAPPARNEATRSVFLWLIAVLPILMLADSFGYRVPGPVLVASVIGLVFSVLAHEIGHLLASRIVGFRLLAVGVWPLEVHRTAYGWRVARWTHGNFIGGFVSAYPIRTQNLVKRFIFLTAGGPAASFLVGIAAAVFAANSAVGRATAQLNQIAFWSLLIAFISLIPRRSRSLASDGERIRMLWEGGKEAEQFAAIMILCSGSIGGLRPRDWDPDVVRRAAEGCDDSKESRAANVIRYNWLHDTKQFDEARTELARLLSKPLPKDSETIWRMEAVWFDARHSGNLASAREAFDRQGDPGRNLGVRCAYFKAKAAVHLLERDWHQTELAAAEVLRECAKQIDVGTAIATRDEIEELLNDVRSARNLQSQSSP